MWAKDELNTLKKQFTNEVSNYWRKRAIEASTKSEINMLSKFADRCQSDRDIKNYLNRAKEDPRFAISLSEVDNDVNVFAVANGVIDLNVDLTKESPLRPSNKKEILFHKVLSNLTQMQKLHVGKNLLQDLLRSRWFRFNGKNKI